MASLSKALHFSYAITLLKIQAMVDKVKYILTLTVTDISDLS